MMFGNQWQTRFSLLWGLMAFWKCIFDDVLKYVLARVTPWHCKGRPREMQCPGWETLLYALPLYFIILRVRSWVSKAIKTAMACEAICSSLTIKQRPLLHCGSVKFVLRNSKVLHDSKGKARSSERGRVVKSYKFKFPVNAHVCW